MSKCRAGHIYDSATSLACPTCAANASARMMTEFMDRAVISGERAWRYCDHIVLGADFWRRILTKQGVSTLDRNVPAICGSDVPLADIGRAERKKVEQDKGKCFRCEKRLDKLADERKVG